MNKARWADLVNRTRIRLELKLNGKTDGLVFNMNPSTLDDLFSGQLGEVRTWPGVDPSRFEFIGLTFAASAILSKQHIVVTQDGNVVALVDGHKEEIKV